MEVLDVMDGILTKLLGKGLSSVFYTHFVENCDFEVIIIYAKREG